MIYHFNDSLISKNGDDNSLKTLLLSPFMYDEKSIFMLDGLEKFIHKKQEKKEENEWKNQS